MVNKKIKETISAHAYYKTGGTCDAFYQPGSVDELAHAMRDIHKQNLPFFYLGGGTNSLISDEHWRGAVISFAKMRRLDCDGTTLTVGAGIENTEFAKFALAKELAGAGWMNRLPGQIGGTVRMNARCYGGEISQIVTDITTVDAKGNVQKYKGRDVFRGYKDTLFMERNEAIAEVMIELKKGDAKEIKKLMDHCENDRTSKGQFVYPTCGCVFKNDYKVGVPSGMLLEAAGAKGLASAVVKINPHHANFVYNVNATAQDILETTFQMREMVYAKFGVWMEYEMEILGKLTPAQELRIKDVRTAKWNESLLDALRKKFRGHVT